jgi:hypothetical protein
MVIAHSKTEAPSHKSDVLHLTTITTVPRCGTSGTRSSRVAVRLNRPELAINIVDRESNPLPCLEDGHHAEKLDPLGIQIGVVYFRPRKG